MLWTSTNQSKTGIISMHRTLVYRIPRYIEVFLLFLTFVTSRLRSINLELAIITTIEERPIIWDKTIDLQNEIESSNNDESIPLKKRIVWKNVKLKCRSYFVLWISYLYFGPVNPWLCLHVISSVSARTTFEEFPRERTRTSSNWYRKYKLIWRDRLPSLLYCSSYSFQI